MANLSKKDKQGLVLIAVVIAIFAGLFAVSWRLSDKPILDDRGCPATVSAKTVIIIDRSDDTPSQTVQEIAARVKRFVADRAQQNELISLFEISGASRTSLEPVFSACMPQRDGNDLYENRKKIQRFFEEKFNAPLVKALEGASTKSESSPISEAIIDVTASDYLSAPQSRLLVFSDLLQHSDNTSLYGCASGAAAISEFRSKRAGAIERPTFKNTVVELNVIPREGIGRDTVQCRDAFWAWFFGDNEGAQSGLEINMLPGGAKVP